MSAYRNPTQGRVFSPFAPSRRHPITGKVQPHNGADVVNALGTPVRAAHGGIVRTGYEENGGGHWVIVTSGDVETRYLHLSRRDVKPGQKVKAGDQVGLMGTTGASTGVHLHFEVRVNGTPTDPVPWLAARGVTLGTDTPPPTTEEDTVIVIRRLAGSNPARKYALISGGRARPISHAAYSRLKKAGHQAVQLPDADYDGIVKAWA